MTETRSADLERQAEAARAQLSATADRLKAKMSPGQMMDEVLQQFKGGDGGQMVANLKGQVRDNPMALALIGSGLAWLMMGSGEAGRKEDAHSSHGGVSDDLAWGSGHGSVGEPSVTERAAGAISSARDGVGDAFSTAGSKLGEIAGSAKDLGSGAIGGARHAAGSIGGQANRTFFDVLEREPLVIGALGIAVGAAIGAALPATHIEKAHLANVGHGLKDKVGALVDKGMSEVKTAASDVYEAARDEADSQGLLGGEDSLSAKVGNVAQAARDKAAEVVDQRLRRQDEAKEEEGEERSPRTPGSTQIG